MYRCVIFYLEVKIETLNVLITHTKEVVRCYPKDVTFTELNREGDFLLSDFIDSCREENCFSIIESVRAEQDFEDISEYEYREYLKNRDRDY